MYIEIRVQWTINLGSSHSTTQHKQHHRNRLQPKQTTRTYNHSSRRHEQSNIHTLTHKLPQTNIPHTIIKLHKRPQSIHNIQKQNINTTPIQKLCSTRRRAITHTLNIYTSDTPIPQAPVKLTTYADHVNITSTHINIKMAKPNIKTYLHEIHTWT